MNKQVNKLFVAIILFVTMLMPSVVSAAKPIITKVESKGDDLYYIEANPNGGTIAAYVVGQTQSNALSFSTSASATYITVPNGNYNVWVKNTAGEYSNPTMIVVTTSCSNTAAFNKTDTGSYERCYEKYNDGTEKPAITAGGASCAPGYNLASGYSGITYNDCGNKKKPSLVGLPYRFCKVVFNYKCVKVGESSGSSSSSGTSAATGNARLSSLSISTGSLTPNFSGSTYVYSATTSESSVTVNATLANSSASFENGYGPRSVKLNYGTNNILIKTRDGETTATYTIKVKRADGRSSTNTLSSLTVSQGELSPGFSSLTNNYNVNVESNVDSVDIGASLSDSKSSYVDGFGPRNVKLKDGYTRAAIKVRSESGSVRTYTITFLRVGAGEETTPSANDGKALLKSLELSEGTIDFNSTTFDYNISVPFDVTNIAVTALAENEKDGVVVTGGENLEANALNEITIVVTSADGTSSNTYTVYVTRKEEDLTVSTNSLLKDLIIDGYKLKFDAGTTEYTINLKDGDSVLDITAIPSDDKSTITIDGNEKLEHGSQVKIRVTAEDGTFTDYIINIKNVGKGGNVFLTVIVIILIVAALAYLVLRAMGYKIYLNFGAVKDKIMSLFNRR